MKSGERPAFFRKEMGLSQPQVARALDMAQSKIAKLELGQKRLMMQDAMSFCSVYHLSMVDLDPRVAFRLDQPLRKANRPTPTSRRVSD